MGKHRVINYPDGERALARFDADQPDLVLLDLKLDGEMSGLQLARKLRERGFSGPIIAITALASDEIQERCLEAGCNEYFAKPLEVHRFYRLIQRYAGWPGQRFARTDKGHTPATAVTSG